MLLTGVTLCKRRGRESLAVTQGYVNALDNSSKVGPPQIRTRNSLSPVTVAPRGNFSQTANMADTPASSTRLRLMRRRIPEISPITSSSIALFRLGEVCNHHCPMCSNSGRPEGHLIDTSDLLRRINWLHEQGLRRVVVTGGEPTIHPGFWQVAEHLARADFAWDINSNGTRFGEPGLAARAADLGLLRAIISLHSHNPEQSCLVSGINLNQHLAIPLGIDALLAAGVQVMINLVITRITIGTLSSFVDFCYASWGSRAVLKVVFPSTAGKGGAWTGIQLRYREVVADLLAAQQRAETLELDLSFENVPPCVVGDSRLRNVDRSGFGETHYLEDLEGKQLFSIKHIESCFNAYPETCRNCISFSNCQGVAESYLRSYGAEEFVPLRE